MSLAQLHIDDLEAFKGWLEDHGWQSRDVQEPFEVLRMVRRRGHRRNNLIVQRKDDETEYCSTWGPAHVALRRWLRERSEASNGR